MFGSCASRTSDSAPSFASTAASPSRPVAEPGAACDGTHVPRAVALTSVTLPLAHLAPARVALTRTCKRAGDIRQSGDGHMAVRETWRPGASTGHESVETKDASGTGRRWTDDDWSQRAAQSEGEGNVGLAKALGWFSLALGIAELAAPRGVARLIGVDDDADNRRLLQAVGLRELA